MSADPTLFPCVGQQINNAPRRYVTHNSTFKTGPRASMQQQLKADL